MEIKIEKTGFIEPDDYRWAKVTEMGPVTRIQTYTWKSVGLPVKKIDKDHYIDLRTKEVKAYNKTESRIENVKGVQATLSHIRDLVNCNVAEPANCRWVTLTYAENMTDTERLYNDFHSFWKRFIRWCKSKGFSKPEYLSVIEPQGRGAWHVHAFFIWSTPAPFIPADELSKLWSHGFVKVKSVSNCDNVGAYFSAYLADMPLDDVVKLPVEQQEKIQRLTVVEKPCPDGLNKKIVKGARLHFYPSGMNIIRCSKGIKKPEAKWMSYEEAKEKVSSGKLTFSSGYFVFDAESGKKLNQSTVEYYNLNR